MSKTAANRLSPFTYYNETLQKEYPGWKINVIDNKLKDDAYLPDSQAANSEILFAIGVDPSLIGASCSRWQNGSCRHRIG